MARHTKNGQKTQEKKNKREDSHKTKTKATVTRSEALEWSLMALMSNQCDQLSITRDQPSGRNKAT